MSTKYPKIWTGSSNPGESLVRELQRNEAPFLTARGTDYIARKKGEFVHVETGADDGIYSLGTVDDDPLSTNNVISGTPDIRARFGSRGGFSGRGFGLANIGHSGNGKGIIPRLSGGVTEVFHTRFATDFKHILTFSYVTDNASSPGLYVGMVWRFVRGAMVRPDPEGPRRNTFGFCIRTYLNDQWFFVYIFTMDGGKTWQNSSAGLGGGIEVGVPGISRISPNELFGFLPVYSADRYQSLFLYSADNGATWVAYSAFSMLQNAGLPSPLSYQGFINRISTIRSNFRAVRTVTGDLLFTAVFPWEGEPNDPYSVHIYRSANFPSSFAPVRVHSVASVSSSGVSPNAIDDEFGVVGETPYAVVRTITGAVSYENVPSPVLLRADPSGTVWTEYVLPYKQIDFGLVLGYDRRTLMVPIYEVGENRVRAYLSTDQGETYVPAGIVREGVPAYAPNQLMPDPILRRFGVLRMLRHRGAPANTFPSAPWVGDDRFTPPWLEDE